MVTSATMKPPRKPPIIHGMAACGAWECDKPHVQAAVATTQSRSRPVLLTVPCSVIASPKATWPLNALSLSAGLDVRIRFAMAEILPIDEFLLSPNLVLLNSTPWCLSFPLWAAQDEIAQVDGAAIGEPGLYDDSFIGDGHLRSVAPHKTNSEKDRRYQQTGGARPSQRARSSFATLY